MQSLQLRNDTLIEIATFLVRRWSEKENVTVEFSKIKQSETRLKEKRVLTEEPVEVTVSSKFVQQDDIFTLLTDPFNTTKHTGPIYTIRGNTKDVYTTDIFKIDALKKTNIRKFNYGYTR